MRAAAPALPDSLLGRFEILEPVAEGAERGHVQG
mgnify:CR=1 FL=1